MTWPYPGDSPVARARRVAHAYRAALDQHVPHVCAEVDAIVAKLGQNWAVPTVITHDPDEWLSASEAASLACVQPATLRTLRARGLLKGRKRDNRWEYLCSDVVRLFSQPRERKLGATDTLLPSGTTVPRTNR